MFLHRSKHRLHPIDIGAYRRDLHGRMQVVSVRGYQTIIHYVAPPAVDLQHLMASFYQYANRKENTREEQIAHAFIAHLIFVLIHPFDDGNGRMARLINDNLLARSKIFSNGYYGLSLGIYKTRKEYYDPLDILGKQEHNNLTEWVQYGVLRLERGIDLALQYTDLFILKAHIFKCFSQELSDNQTQIINLLFERHLKNLRGDCVGAALKVKQKDIELDILHLKDLGILKEVASKHFELDFSMAKG
ncbi:Fic family protein [Helicobacter bizzozeronii]|uniref:Fic family protein n=1 Tax=Helicobacter bizzozeronii TaxID=56877 RepID=UPI001F206427|nr:Fic family protein [Helicobacter bizzozeronii]